MKVNHSSHMIRPKRRLQDYFDPSHGFVTPNQRSLPKYRNLFDKPRGKSGKKEQLLDFYVGVLSDRKRSSAYPGEVAERAFELAKWRGDRALLRSKLEAALRADPDLDRARRTLDLLK